MGVMVDAVDWVTADRFCELTGEQVTNLKNLRPQWDEGLVWVKVSDRRIMYSIKGYNAWVEQAALAKGTRARSGKIQINFKWDGKRAWFTLNLTDTPANLSKAAKIREDLVSKEKFGLLTPADIDAVAIRPITKTAEEPAAIASGPTFGDYAQQYLYNLTNHKQGTREKYLSILERIWMPLFAETPIDQITSQMLRNAVNGREWTSPKVRNDALIPLRGTFELAADDEAIDKDPCDRLKNQKKSGG